MNVRTNCEEHPDSWPKDLSSERKTSRFIKLRLAACDGPLWVTLGYEYLKGNNLPYWSITASGRGRGGCLHEEIIALRSDLQPFVDLHLHDIDGLPMHAAGNGAYYAKQYLCMALQKGKDYDELVKKVGAGKSGSALVEAMGEVPAKAKALEEAALATFMRHFSGAPEARSKLESIKIAVAEEDLGSPLVEEFIKARIADLVDKMKPAFAKKSEDLYQLMKKVAKANFEAASEEMKGFDELMEELGVSVDIESIGARADGIEWANPGAGHFKVTVNRGEKEIAFEYSVGSLCDDPESHDVINNLFDEYDLLSSMSSFEDFCRNLGYDEDSRKAKAAWDHLEETAKAIEAMFTDAERVALKDMAEDKINEGG